MTDNVISIGSRKPYLEEQAEKRKERRSAQRKKRKEETEAVADHKRNLLDMLDETRALVEKNELHGLIIIGRNPKSKLFLTEFVLDECAVPRSDIFSYIGNIEVLNLELKELALMAPALMPDGSTLDPFLDPEIVIIDGDYE